MALSRRDERIKELLADTDERDELLQQYRDHAEAQKEMMARWTETFDMYEREPGLWVFPAQTEAWDRYAELVGKHNALVEEFNKLVGKWNARVAPRDPGRPLGASDAQQDEVRKLHKEGRSRRFIAERTGLGERTVRTIIEQKHGKDRTSIKRKFERKQVLDKLRAAAYRAKIKARDEYLPKRIREQERRTDELIAAAKGLGKDKR